MISGFHCEVDENCALLGYYATSSGNSLLTFHDSLSVPSPRVKNAETSVRNYHYLLHNNPKEHSSQMLINLALEENRSRLKVLLFRRKTTLSVKHVDLRDMFQKAAKSVCTSSIWYSLIPCLLLHRLLQL